mgnify:CR=1 FL=1
MNKDLIISKLKTGPCYVEFIKSNGIKRAMLCTLNETYLPVTANGESKTRKENPDVVSVWDLEKKDWRSFRLDRFCFIQEQTHG